MAQKNVLVTTMSTLSRELKANWYYYLDGKDKLYCDGISALEAGTKYFLSKYRIDKIVVIGSKETGCRTEEGVLDTEKMKDFEELYAEKKYTACEFYRYRIAAFLWKERIGSNENFSDVTEEIIKDSENFATYESEKKIIPCKENMENTVRICFVPEQLEGNPNIDNISGIVEAVRGDYKEQINLYIDMQGGNRTSGFVRNAVLSILNNQNFNQITIKEIVATKYEPSNKEHQIVEETYRYRILDLVSGMNAFIQYGKADMLQKYCKDMEIEDDSSVGKLVKHMSEIDEAISLCDVNSLVEAIKQLEDFFKKEVVEENTYVGNIFHILQTEIQKDYGELLKNEKVDYLELISWCVRKGFVQQALTLIEDKMPEVYIGEGKVISWETVGVDDAKKKDFLKNLGQKYEKDENKISNSLEKKCLKKQYLKRIDTKGKDKAEILKTLKGNLDQEKNNDKFREKYCRFRKWEDIYENSDKPFLDYYGWDDKNLYFSIVRCCGKKEYTIDKDKKNDSRDNLITINIKMHPKVTSNDYKKSIDNLFLLHEALKKERNCSNHASDKGVRLSVKTVKRAIEIYIEMAREILSRIS